MEVAPSYAVLDRIKRSKNTCCKVCIAALNWWDEPANRSRLAEAVLYPKTIFRYTNITDKDLADEMYSAMDELSQFEARELDLTSSQKYRLETIKNKLRKVRDELGRRTSAA